MPNINKLGSASVAAILFVEYNVTELCKKIITRKIRWQIAFNTNMLYYAKIELTVSYILLWYLNTIMVQSHLKIYYAR